MTPLFITAERIKKFGIIEGNVSDELIEPTIIMVQDIWLQQIIGTDMYNDICSEINANTVTAKYITLLDDWIENFMHSAVVSEGIITFNFRIGNKAVVTDNSANQSPVSIVDLELISQKHKNNAEFYGKRLSGFLRQNQTNYPLYLSGNNELGDIRPTPQKYSTGIYLGNKNRKYIYDEFYEDRFKDC